MSVVDREKVEHNSGNNIFWKALNFRSFDQIFGMPPTGVDAQEAVFDKVARLTTIKDSKEINLNIRLDAARKLQDVLPLVRGFGFKTERPIKETENSNSQS